MSNIEILAEAAALHLAPMLRTPDNFGLVWHDSQGERHIRVFGQDKVEETLRELYPLGIFEGARQYVLATLVPESFLLVETGWGHRLHFKHNTVDGKVYLRRTFAGVEEPHWTTFTKFNQVTNAMQDVENETRTRLEATAKTLKSETLFPKKVEAAKRMFEGVESLPTQDPETGGEVVRKAEAVTSLPTARLLEKLHYHQGKMSNVAYSEGERLGHGTRALACGAELDARCEKAGIRRNIDGTFSIQPCTLSVEEMGEHISLINYFTHRKP